MLGRMRTPLRLATASYVLFGLLILPLASQAAGSGSGKGTRDASAARASIDEMKASPRGGGVRRARGCTVRRIVLPANR